MLPSDMYLVSTMVRISSSTAGMPSAGKANTNTPVQQAMPLPPLKPKYSGQLWPMMAKKPAAIAPFCPAIKRPSSTAPMALAQSKINVMVPAFMP